MTLTNSKVSLCYCALEGTTIKSAELFWQSPL